MDTTTFITSFFKMKESITIKVMRFFVIFALLVSVILIPVGLYLWMFGAFYQNALGIGLILYGITGIISSFFLQGFIYIVKAAIFYLEQNGQVEKDEGESDDETFSED